METFVNLAHLVVCVLIIALVLLQPGKDSSLGGVFGGGSSQTVFGARGAVTFLYKLTIIAGIIFLATSLYLANASKKVGQSSVIERAHLPSVVSPKPQGETVPAGVETKSALDTETKSVEQKK